MPAGAKGISNCMIYINIKKTRFSFGSSPSKCTGRASTRTTSTARTGKPILEQALIDRPA
jgi:hypothetical protein